MMPSQPYLFFRGGSSERQDSLRAGLTPEQLGYMYPLGGERGAVGKVVGLHPTFRYLDRMFRKTIDCKGGDKGTIAYYS
jgi:hypothetical protein